MDPVPSPPAEAPFDLLVVGGGINGAGIARDAAGRGWSVMLVEAGDLAGGTSSASTKLIHGGLRYLEYYALRLVREALAEREVLLGIAPHIAWPMRFVLPQPRGGRPGWLIRLGLLLYDHLGGRRSLPRSQAVTLDGSWGEGLRPDLSRGFVYSDGWVDDARLVVLNARDAADRGATIRTRTRLIAARAEAGVWTATLADARGRQEVRARAIVNAGGGSVAAVLRACAGAAPVRPPRLVKGSHIVVPRLHAGEHAYLFQNKDKRVVFAIPYEGRFTLIGTTDVTVDTADAPGVDDAEVQYLCDSVNAYLATPIAPADVVWRYAGVRALHDDGRADAASVTRDYHLELDRSAGAPILSVIGGKITTYRRLAEHALEMLAPHGLPMAGAWTGSVPLPGGDRPVGEVRAMLGERWPFLPAALADRLARSYGTDAARFLEGASALTDLGRDLDGGLFEAEVRHLMAREWAQTADDILWRRTKLGLHTGPETAAALAAMLEEGA